MNLKYGQPLMVKRKQDKTKIALWEHVFFVLGLEGADTILQRVQFTSP